MRKDMRKTDTKGFVFNERKKTLFLHASDAADSMGGGGDILTHVVAVRRLRGSVLQAGQDLPLAHIAVSHQEELEQKVVRLDGTGGPVGHPQRVWSPCPIAEQQTTLYFTLLGA